MPASSPGNRLRRYAAALLAIGCVHPALAWENNHIHMIVGERPLGMGGAYTAISDDPSGLYYNPAGIVYGYAPNLSASVNSWQWTDSRYNDALGGADFERSSSELLPNFFGTTQPVGPLTVGISYAVTRAVREDQIQRFTGWEGAVFDDYTVNVDNQDTETKIGPSAALEINRRFSVGMTLYFHHRKRKTVMNQVIESEDWDQPQWENIYYDRQETGITPIIGALLNAGDRLALGASVRTTEVLSSTTVRQATCHGHSEFPSEAGSLCQPEEVNHNRPVETSPRETYPWEIRFGAAFFATTNLLLAADVIYYTEEGDYEATWNAAAGLEYYLNPRWALRGGLFTNHAHTPELVYDGETVNQPEHVNYYGGTVSISHFARNSSVTLGLTHSIGTGKAQIVGGWDGVQDVEASTTSLFLGTSYSY